MKMVRSPLFSSCELESHIQIQMLLGIKVDGYTRTSFSVEAKPENPQLKTTIFFLFKTKYNPLENNSLDLSGSTLV